MPLYKEVSPVHTRFPGRFPGVHTAHAFPEHECVAHVLPPQTTMSTSSHDEFVLPPQTTTSSTRPSLRLPSAMPMSQGPTSPSSRLRASASSGRGPSLAPVRCPTS